MKKALTFIIKYANYKIDEIMKEGVLDADRAERIRKIDRAVCYYKAGSLTVDETMREISEQ